MKRTGVWAGALLLGALVCPGRAAAQAPAPASGELPVSLERIRAAVERPEGPALDLSAPLQQPAARFTVTVEQRSYMLSFEEQLHKDLELTPLQRQSRDWASRCCGIDLGLLLDPIDRALERRKVRKLRERIARELEDLAAVERR